MTRITLICLALLCSACTTATTGPVTSMLQVYAPTDSAATTRQVEIRFYPDKMILPQAAMEEAIALLAAQQTKGTLRIIGGPDSRNKGFKGLQTALARTQSVADKLGDHDLETSLEYDPNLPADTVLVRIEGGRHA